jgi:uncharacterized membrane protein (UPF0136 family)
MTQQVFKKIGIIVFIYSILVFSGGVMGFVKGGSMPSLVAGSLFGLTLLFASVKTMIFRRWALILSLILMLVLDCFFSYRYLKTASLLPAGAMLLLTSFFLILTLFQLRKLKKSIGRNA